MKRTANIAAVLALAFVAAKPSAAPSPDESLRRGDALLDRGEPILALAAYTDAEPGSRDPGHVAFNSGHAHFALGQYREAELDFNRALADAEATPARRSRAYYNAGACLIRRGGLQELRTAIDRFERCLALEPDDGLQRDARYNLELAKRLWMEARDRQREKPKPNDLPPERPPEAKPKPQPPSSDRDPSESNGTGAMGTKPIDTVKPQLGSGPPKATDQTIGGKGTIPVTSGGREQLNLTDEELAQYLRNLNARVAKERRSTRALTAPPIRPNVKDW